MLIFTEKCSTSSGAKDNEEVNCRSTQAQQDSIHHRTYMLCYEEYRSMHTFNHSTPKYLLIRL